MQSRSLRVALLVAAFLVPSCGQPAAADIGTGYRKEYRATVVQNEPRTPRRPRQVAQSRRSAPKPVAKAQRAVRPVSVKPVAVKVRAGSVPARIAAAWPGDDAWVLKVVACESGFNPSATGGTGNAYQGLFQFGPWARSRDGMGDPRRQSVEVQTQRAWSLIKATSSSQWSCSPWAYNP